MIRKEFKLPTFTALDIIADDAYLVSKGARPCVTRCYTFYEDDEIEEFKSEIEQIMTRYNIYCKFERLICEGEDDDIYHLRIFIFKYHYQSIVIDYMIHKTVPHSFMYEFLLGTMLGYPPPEMEDYLTNLIYEKVGQAVFNAQSMEEDEGGLMDNEENAEM